MTALHLLLTFGNGTRVHLHLSSADSLRHIPQNSKPNIPLIHFTALALTPSLDCIYMSMFLCHGCPLRPSSPRTQLKGSSNRCVSPHPTVKLRQDAKNEAIRMSLQKVNSSTIYNVSTNKRPHPLEQFTFYKNTMYIFTRMYILRSYMT